MSPARLTSAHVGINLLKLLLERIKVLEKRSNVLSGIIILLYTGVSVNGVTSPVLVVLGDPPAVLLVLLSVLVLFKFEKGVEISMDSPAQFKIPAEEAPSALSALCVAKRVSPSSELWRGGVLFSVAPFTLGVLRALSESRLAASLGGAACASPSPWKES